MVTADAMKGHLNKGRDPWSSLRHQDKDGDQRWTTFKTQLFTSLIVNISHARLPVY